MKVLAITDSLGLPRAKPEFVAVEKTWINRLSNVHEVVYFSYGGGTIDQLFSQVEYLKLYNPDLVIVQAGIVDCAPRALTKTENILINNFRLTKYIFSKLVTEKELLFLRRSRKKTYTSLPRFEYYMNQLFRIFGEKLFWIGILPALPGYEKKVPGVLGNINNYNTLIERKLGNRFISTSHFTDLDIMTDFIHLTEKGNDRLANLILERIEGQ